ncbi:MAG: hypothetical protein ACE5FB_01135, partial [Candidatus Binatia bacterium]
LVLIIRFDQAVSIYPPISRWFLQGSDFSVEVPIPQNFIRKKLGAISDTTPVSRKEARGYNQ